MLMNFKHGMRLTILNRLQVHVLLIIFLLSKRLGKKWTLLEKNTSSVVS